MPIDDLSITRTLLAVADGPSVATVLQAVGLFLATNIDDVIVLSLFFARGAGRAGTTARIAVGQYLGFAGILITALLVAWGAGLVLPPSAIPYFGLIPLAVGIWAGVQAWRGEGDDDEEKVEGKRVEVELVVEAYRELAG